MRGYLALLSAIGLEVFGTLSLKFAALGTLPLGWLLTALCVGGSYVLLSLAFRHIPVAVAFALWEVVGLLLITLLGFVLLGESLSATQSAALLLLGAGAYLLHRGVRREAPAESQTAGPQTAEPQEASA